MGFAVEVESVLGESTGTGGGGVGAKVGLGERDGEGGVCGEIEIGVTFAPVSGVWMLVIWCGGGICGGDMWGGMDEEGGGELLDDGNVDGGGGARRVDFRAGHCRYVDDGDSWWREMEWIGGRSSSGLR